MRLSGRMIKAARLLAGMKQDDLASKSGLNINTIRKMESSDLASVEGNVKSLNAVVSALERSGIHIDDATHFISLRRPHANKD